MSDNNSQHRNESNGMVATESTSGTDRSLAANQPVNNGNEFRGNWWEMARGFAFRLLIIYFISSLFRRNSTPPPAVGPDGNPLPQPLPSSNVFPKGTKMDLYVYLSECEKHTEFLKEELFWRKRNLIYGDWSGGPDNDGTFYKHDRVLASENLMNNGSLYIHVYIVRAGLDLAKAGDRDKIHKSSMLSRYKKRRFVNTVNLLTGETEAHPDLIQRPNASSTEILASWHPNISLNIVDDHTPWTPGSIPAPLDQYYWNLHSDYMPINETTPRLNLSITFYPLSLFRWQMYAAQTMRSQWSGMFGADMSEMMGSGHSDEEQDSMKRTFLDTNPYLLAITIVVSLVHSVFEFLAFKNDIQFWRNRKSLEGLSVRSVFFNVFQSLIVLLYVFDNEANFVIRISVVVGLGIEIWKIHKVVDVQYDRTNRILGIFPRISFQDKQSYEESHTKEYDQQAFRYLSWLLFPLLGLYAVYSLAYNEHRGWYSFVLGMCYGFLLTFGFIMMTPQLFINYKLKSVAHLPWRMLTYRALNTFIDDLFAFVIKMPTLYRLGCFRDDIIFFIYLYQRYIYPIDPKRINEFGTCGEDFSSTPAATDSGATAVEGASAGATAEQPPAAAVTDATGHEKIE